MSKKYSTKGSQYELWSDHKSYGEYEGKKGTTWKSCFESHPPLQIGPYTVYGGSCSRPIIKDADVYIGLDASIQLSSKSWPWEAGDEFLYPITDMCAPKDPVSFRKLIDWIHAQMELGKKVHIGCIGGHGRTGTVLAALYNAVTHDPDAIKYVRKNYCEKAVESQDQVEFLHKHFGITKEKPYKSSSGHGTTVTAYKGGSSTSSYPSSSHHGHGRGSRVPMIRGAKGNVWGDTAR